MKRNHFYFFWRAVLLPFFKLIYRMKYIGRENVPENGAYILASNHRLATDPIMLGMGLKRQLVSAQARRFPCFQRKGRYRLYPPF